MITSLESAILHHDSSCGLQDIWRKDTTILTIWQSKRRLFTIIGHQSMNYKQSNITLMGYGTQDGEDSIGLISRADRVLHFPAVQSQLSRAITVSESYLLSIGEQGSWVLDWQGRRVRAWESSGWKGVVPWAIKGNRKSDDGRAALTVRSADVDDFGAIVDHTEVGVAQ